MNQHILMNRAAQATAAINNAKTPMQKRDARRDGLAIKADLEKEIADSAAIAAFKKAKPQSMAGMWSEPVSDRPIFMVAQSGLKITGPITLPDGSKAVPNASYQIVVPMKFVPAMIARGFIRANSVITHPDTTMRDPVRANII